MTANDLGNPFVASGIRLLDYLITDREAIEFLKNGITQEFPVLDYVFCSEKV